MRLWELGLMFIGQIWSYVPAGSVWRTNGSPGNVIGSPPVDFTMRTQAELLASFSDAIGPDGITPKSMRDFVGSTVTMNPGGVPPSAPLPLPGWTTATRPTGMVGPCIGFNYDLQTLDMWDDQAGVWVNPSFNGGTVTGNTTFVGATYFAGQVVVTFPNTCAAVAPGTLWNNGQTVGICP